MVDIFPEPTIEEVAGGIQITFLKDLFSEGYFKRLGLNERQLKAVEYVKKNGSINNSVYQQINDVGKTTATEDLQMLVEKGILKQQVVKEEEQNMSLDNWLVIGQQLHKLHHAPVAS